MNTSLSPDERADLVIKEMTIDEKIALLHGVGMPTDEPVTQENAASNRGVGFTVGVPRQIPTHHRHLAQPRHQPARQAPPDRI